MRTARLGIIPLVNSPWVIFAAGLTGVCGFVASNGDAMGVPLGVSLALGVVCLAGIIGILLYYRSITANSPPSAPRTAPEPVPAPPPPPPPPPSVAVPGGEESVVNRKVTGIACPICGYRFTEKMLPRHMEIVHKRSA